MNAAELLEAHTGYRATTVEVVQTAAKHAVWRCDEGFYVKIGTRDNFILEASTHALAARTGIPVPEVVAVGDGFLISRAVGGVTAADERLDVDARRSALAEAGALLRKLHAVGAPGFGIPRSEELRGPHPSWIEHMGSVLEWAAPAVADLVDLDVIHDAFERHRDAIADVAQGSVLHGDLSMWHILVDPASGKITAVIDWADVQVGDPLLEIAVLGSWIPKVIPRFLAGYEPDERFVERADELLTFYRVWRHTWGYRAGIEDGWDESQRLSVLRDLIDELRRA